ncbi:hypothetical protein CROQUDRAFT_715149 [Cronartium quercuum f. sp. fusiforme G11]|uniref:methylated diphthine methylhydrolase n=1 Tax=Cronartium quercuum f. sp. fusiforme G11 TaxID=708437 RepID=A0A9P6NPG5_9BASI|nr:hypothetical protein CROQUDRAFT_715149 [Cronartium quercuum f. sp. fusiforme G11]
MESQTQLDENINNSLPPPPPRIIEAKQAKSLCSIDTQYTACSIEFCPSKPNLLVCGLYQTVQEVEGTESNQDLESPKTKRLGRCLLFEQLNKLNLETSDPSPDEQDQQRLECKPLQEIEGPAILDQRWTQDSNSPVLITADAQGFLNSFLLENEPILGYPQLRPIEQYSCAPKDVLCLALDISDKVYSTGDKKVVTSLSNGEILLLDHASETHLLAENSRWHGHDFEPWTCGFDYWQTCTILTGGDDCKWKIWDTRSGTTVPIFTNKKFEGGVTAVRSHHLREHLYAVGSYDSYLRIFDKRQLSEPLFKDDMGGGIWRLKWHPTQPNYLLIASMHDGFKVVEIPENVKNQTIRILTRFDQHTSLAYGVDWGKEEVRVGKSINNSTLVGSCSFYDHIIHLWKFYEQE